MVWFVAFRDVACYCGGMSVTYLADGSWVVAFRDVAFYFPFAGEVFDSLSSVWLSRSATQVCIVSLPLGFLLSADKRNKNS